MSANERRKFLLGLHLWNGRCIVLIRTLALSGFKSNKATYIGLALLIMLMAATLTFTLCLYIDLNDRIDQAMGEAQAGDVFLMNQESEISDGLIADIEGLENVDRVKVTDSIVASTNYENEHGDTLGSENQLNVTYMPWGEAIDFNVYEQDQGSLGLISHSDSKGPSSGEIYVPIGTQATLGLSIGDKVLTSIGNTEFEFTLAKFFEDPQLGSPFVEMGQYVISDTDFSEMYRAADYLTDSAAGFLLQAGAGTAYHARTLNIYMTDEAHDSGMTSSELAADIDDGIDASSLSTGFLSAEVLMGYSMIVVTITCAMLLVFALLMFIIALVISIHTVSSSIKENFTNYAILKAVGVSNASLRFSLSIQYVACVLLGCIVGTIIGLVLLPLVLPVFAVLTGVLAHASGIVIPLYVALIVLIVAIALMVYAKTRRVARISPLAALRSGVEDVHFNSLLNVPVTGRPLSLRLSWRAITSAKRNYAGLFACALLLSAFVMLTFGIGASLNTMDDSYRAFGVWKSDLSVKLSDDVDIDDIESSLDDEAPIAKVWQEGMVMQNIDGESRTIIGLSDFSLLSGIGDGAAPTYDNEVVIGYKLADYMGLAVGDEIMLTDANGEKRPYLVSGLLSAMLNAGYGIVMTYDALGEVMGDNGASDLSYQILLEDLDQVERAKEILEDRFGDSVDTTATGIFVSTADLMVLIHDIFICAGYGMDAIAVLLAVLSVSLIIRRMFDMERRDLGVYRALGFKPSSLKLQFSLRFFIVSVLGCIVAAILVTLGGSWLTSQLFGSFGVTKFSIDTSPLLIGGIICGLALIFFLAAYWSARRIRSISTSILITD